MHRARKTLLTGEELLSERGKGQLEELFADPGHQVVEATWKVYQRMVAVYRAPVPRERKERLRDLIHDLTKTLPKEMIEVRSLATTLKKRASDILAYFDHMGSSNGPTEAINGRLEHLRGSALGFRNLANYIARSLLESGGFRPVLHP